MCSFTVLPVTWKGAGGWVGVSINGVVPISSAQFRLSAVRHRLGSATRCGHVAATSAEAEQMEAQRVAIHYLLNLQRQACKALPHIGVASRKPHAYKAALSEGIQLTVIRRNISATPGYFFTIIVREHRPNVFLCVEPPLGCFLNKRVNFSVIDSP
jgi:hypothetical protein